VCTAGARRRGTRAKRRVVLPWFLIVIAVSAAGRDVPAAEHPNRLSYDLSVRPAAVIPVPTDVYRPGMSATVQFAVPTAISNWLRFSADLEYFYLPVRAPEGLSALRAGVGPEITLSAHSLMTGTVGISLGGYFGLLHGDLADRSALALQPAGSVRICGRAEITPTWGVGVGMSFSYLHCAAATIGVGLEVTYRRRPHGELQIVPEPPGPVFPTLSVSSLHATPIELTVVNNGRFPAEAMVLSVSAPPYVNEQVVWEQAAPLPPGAHRTISVSLPVNRRALGIVQGLSLPLEYRIHYTAGGVVQEGAAWSELSIHDRNAIVWDDDRKASLFVTEKDEWVLSISGQVAALASRGGYPPINQTFHLAAAMVDALAALGFTYVVDPASPYATMSDGGAVDFLRFPRETIARRAGDCDDLTVLYCALLESIGVRTAFVTVPGHIFAAVDLGLSAGEARRIVFSSNDLIYREDSAWLPIEVTALGDGFAAAWRIGANEVKEYRDQMGFHVVQEAWDHYPPVALEMPQSEAPVIPATAFVDLHERILEQILSQELIPLASALTVRMGRSGESPRLLNALGVLYARYGQLDEAQQMFEAAIDLSEYLPALVNLGNAHFLAGELDLARVIYERAAGAKPGDPLVLLCMSRVNYELGRYGDSRRYYAQLEQADANLASQNAYLAVAILDTRGSGVVMLSDRVAWMEEADE